MSSTFYTTLPIPHGLQPTGARPSDMNFSGHLHGIDGLIPAAPQTDSPRIPEAFSAALLGAANTMTKPGTSPFVPDDTGNVVFNFVTELRSFIESYVSESSYGLGMQQRLISRLNGSVAKLLCPYAGIGMPSKVFPLTLPDEIGRMCRSEPSPDLVQLDCFRCEIKIFLQQFEIAQNEVADDVVLIHLFHSFMGCAKHHAKQFNKEFNISSESSSSQIFAASHVESVDNRGSCKDNFRSPLYIEPNRAISN